VVVGRVEGDAPVEDSAGMVRFGIVDGVDGAGLPLREGDGRGVEGCGVEVIAADGRVEAIGIDKLVEAVRWVEMLNGPRSGGGESDSWKPSVDDFADLRTALKCALNRFSMTL